VAGMDSERPERGDRASEEDFPGRTLLERLVPEIIKRLVETGVGKIAEGPENLRNFVSELKLPKEIVTYLLVQIDETKNGVYRVVSKEIRDFLQETNFGEELTKILTKLSFEIKTEIRFIPNDAAGPNSVAKPDVRTSVQVKSDRGSDRAASRDRHGERAPRSDRPPVSTREGRVIDDDDVE
jgi:hypothetical protein